MLACPWLETKYTGDINVLLLTLILPVSKPRKSQRLSLADDRFLAMSEWQVDALSLGEGFILAQKKTAWRKKNRASGLFPEAAMLNFP